ncbi:MAG: hypothetical protein Q8L47_02745 [bacterium]|nr:hypothetical protein [bacterium]
MNNFKSGGFSQRGSSSGSRSKFGGGGGGRDRGNNRDRRSPELFQAVCAECKKQCQVPFRPSQDKPVYCRDCFGKQRYVPGRNSNGQDGNPRTQRAEQSSYDGPRPEIRRDFAPERESQTEYVKPQSNEGIEALARQISTLDSKLNRILEMLVKKEVKQSVITPIAKEVAQIIKAAKPKASPRKIIKKKK